MEFQYFTLIAGLEIDKNVESVPRTYHNIVWSLPISPHQTHPLYCMILPLPTCAHTTILLISCGGLSLTTSLRFLLNFSLPFHLLWFTG